MGKALYRKYRSKSLSELVGQEHITDGLNRAIENGNISHAYLFTGPRGVGKTSVARILAHQINDLPYESDDTNHLDIIEIDAASNRRIDEIRELKARAHIAPTSAKYKVYIIDEVHMLTKEAFNALLKTLEEPPAHVVFILATTEVHKLPETIISRTQRFGFKPIDDKQVIKHLASIAKQEKLKITDEALELIAQHGEGSFRDSISLLDQVQHLSDEITYEHVAAALGLAPADTINSLVTALNDGNLAGMHTALHQAKTAGVQPLQIAKQLSQRLVHQLVEAQASDGQSIVAVLDQLARLPSHPNPQLGLELILYEPVIEQAPRPAVQAAKPAPAERPEPKTSEKLGKETPVKEESVIDTTEKPETANLLAEKPADTVTRESVEGGELEEHWPAVLDALKTRYNTLYGVIRMAKPTFGASSVELSFKFPFHQKKLKEAKNQKLLIDTYRELTGAVVTVTAVHDKPKAPGPSTKITKDDGDLKTISNIFDGAELVE